MQNNVGVQELPKVGSLPVLRACVRRMRVVVLRFFVEEDYLTQAVWYWVLDVGYSLESAKMEKSNTQFPTS